MTTTTTIPEPATNATRPVRHCQGCGERSGSVSAGTGRPLMRDNASGLFFHLSCKPGAAGIGAALASFASLEGLES
jgi:hypothetical protein